MDVHREDLPISLTTGSTHQNSGAVCVEQSSLDIEFWINSVLEAEMKKQGLEYRSLMDYDLQVYDVSQRLCQILWCVCVCVCTKGIIKLPTIVI